MARSTDTKFFATLGYGTHVYEDGKVWPLSPQEKAYYQATGKLPEKRYTDQEWPMGPIKAKRLAKQMVEEEHGGVTAA